MADADAKILIVDDEEEITIAIGDYFTHHSLGIAPLVTNDPRQVFPILAEHEDVRLILSDFRMPAINGLDLLLRVKAQYPQIKFIIMTAFGTPELRKEGLKRGAIRYIEKPFDIGELAQVVQDALKDTPSGFGGMIESVQLEDIIQLIGLGQRTVALNISANEGKGTTYFVEGEIVHAICGDLEGEEAFYKMFCWTGGQFALSSLSGDPKRTISQSWQGMLLEAARLQDEALAKKADLLPSDDEPSEEETVLAGIPDEDSLLEPEAHLDELNSDLDLSTLEPAQAVENEIIAEPKAEKSAPPEPEPEPETDAESSDSGYDLFSLVSDGHTEHEEPASTEPTTVHKGPVDEKPLNEKRIGEALDSAVDYFMKVWPADVEEIPFSALPLTKLSVNVRRHLFYRFHQLSMQVINTDGVPFDFSNEKVVDAVRNLLQVLRENWMITADSFRKMIHDAIRFDLARSIDPARAVAQFLNESTSGNAIHMKSLLRALIEHELIDQSFKELLQDLTRQSDTKIHPRKIENFARAIMERRDEDEGYEATRQSMMRTFEIAGLGRDKKPSCLHTNVLMNMLESRGLAHIADFMKSDKRFKKTSMTLDDLDNLMDSYRFISGRTK